MKRFKSKPTVISARYGPISFFVTDGLPNRGTLTVGVPIVLAVNKWDLAKDRQIDASDAMRFLREYDAEHFFTSARTGENVEAAFQALGERITMYRRARPSGGAPHGPP